MSVHIPYMLIMVVESSFSFSASFTAGRWFDLKELVNKKLFRDSQASLSSNSWQNSARANTGKSIWDPTLRKDLELATTFVYFPCCPLISYKPKINTSKSHIPNTSISNQTRTTRTWHQSLPTQIQLFENTSLTLSHSPIIMVLRGNSL